MISFLYRRIICIIYNKSYLRSNSQLRNVTKGIKTYTAFIFILFIVTNEEGALGATMTNFFKELSLDNCDLPAIMRNIGAMLRILTVNIDRNYTQSISCIYYFILIFCVICYSYAYIFSMVWFVLVRCPETGDFTSAMVVFSLTMCSFFFVPKILYMKSYSKTVMSLVDEYLNCNKLIVKGTRFEANVLKTLRLIKKQSTAIWIFMLVNAVVYTTLPFIRPGRHFPEDLIVLYGLEPMFESPNYEIASFLSTVSVFFTVITTVHITLFIIVLIGFLESQMLALSEELIYIWQDSEKFYNYHKIYNRGVVKDTTRNIFLKMRLRDILNFQILNVNIRNKVERELRFIFATDFTLVIFAIVSELVGGLENTILELQFTIGILFIDCYIGQRLIDASTVFEKAVYNCKWENFNASNQKTVLFMLQCSQKTMTLSAGGITLLNYPSLMYIFRTTYSAYTTLKSSA